MDQKSILISLGIGSNQIPLIEAALRKGYKVIGIDRDIDQTEEIQGLEKIKCSTFNSEQIIKILPDFLKNSSPNGLLLRTTGPSLISASRIISKYKLKGISKKLADASVRKSILRDQCETLNIPTIKGEVFKNFEKINLSWGNKVIKPDIPLVGKNNIYIPKNRLQAKEYFLKVQEESYNDLVEVQDYTDGIDISFMVFCNNSKVSKSLVFEEWVEIKNNKFFGVGVSILKKNKLQNIIDQMIIYAEKLINFWEFNIGVVFFTFRFDENKILKLYEVNPGLAGDKIVDLLLPQALKKEREYFYDLEVLNCTGQPIENEIFNPLELAVIKNQVMSRENAINLIFNNKEYSSLKKRMKNFKKLIEG